MSAFSATWSNEEAYEFEEAIKICEQIDEEVGATLLTTDTHFSVVPLLRTI